jgi:hypothetical protein
MTVFLEAFGLVTLALMPLAILAYLDERFRRAHNISEERFYE